MATGKGQKIALIDSGISSFQNEKVNASNNVVGGGLYDDNGHGTMMLSILKGEGNIEGICPDAGINTYKVVGANGKIDGKILGKAIQMATKDHNDIINISLGSFFNDKYVKKAIQKALKKNIVVVASSGDYDSADMLYPAKNKGVISVGALKKDKTVWEDTNANTECDIIAPGEDIKVVYLDGNATYSDGTSAATAIISGYIALLREYAYKNDKVIDMKKVVKLLTKINNKEISYYGGMKDIITY